MPYKTQEWQQAAGALGTKDWVGMSVTGWDKNLISLLYRTALAAPQRETFDSIIGMVSSSLKFTNFSKLPISFNKLPKSVRSVYV